MYKDIISYELAEGISEDHLRSVARKVADEWMRLQPGFIKWEITRDKEGNYQDIVHWKSREHAQKAELQMVNIPDAGAWFSCYKEGSINSINLSTIASFDGE